MPVSPKLGTGIPTMKKTDLSCEVWGGRSHYNLQYDGDRYGYGQSPAEKATGV